MKNLKTIYTELKDNLWQLQDTCLLSNNIPEMEMQFDHCIESVKEFAEIATKEDREPVKPLWLAMAEAINTKDELEDGNTKIDIRILHGIDTFISYAEDLFEFDKNNTYEEFEEWLEKKFFDKMLDREIVYMDDTKIGRKKMEYREASPSTQFLIDHFSGKGKQLTLIMGMDVDYWLFKDLSDPKKWHILTVDDKGKLYPLKATLDGNGYETVKLLLDRSFQTAKIYCLVARHFCKRNPAKKRDNVHHIDGDKLNNAINNLVWMTRHEHNLYHRLMNIGKMEDAAQLLQSIIDDNEKYGV